MIVSKRPEEWRPIAGYEGLYEVSDHGRVRSLGRETLVSDRWGGQHLRCKRPRILKGVFAGRPPGHLSVNLYRLDGSIERAYIHHLVLKAFVGPRPAGAEGRHIKGDRSNNRLDNLAWGTPIENYADRVRLGEMPRGSTCSYAKLDEQTVHVIREVAAKLFTHRQVADALGISHQQVSRIVRRERWAHLEAA